MDESQNIGNFVEICNSYPARKTFFYEHLLCVIKYLFRIIYKITYIHFYETICYILPSGYRKRSMAGGWHNAMLKTAEIKFCTEEWMSFVESWGNNSTDNCAKRRRAANWSFRTGPRPRHMWLKDWTHSAICLQLLSLLSLCTNFVLQLKGRVNFFCNFYKRIILIISIKIE